MQPVNWGGPCSHEAALEKHQSPNTHPWVYAVLVIFFA